MKTVIDNTLGWCNLSSLGKNKMVKSSYFWIVFVPIFAKILVGIEKIMTFNIFGETLSFHVGLPFSWKLLFFASLAFSAGTFIYGVFCPKIIKEFKDFPDFENKRISERALVKMIVDFLRKFETKNKMFWKSHSIESVQQFANYTVCIWNPRPTNKSRIGTILEDIDLFKKIRDYLIRDELTVESKNEAFEDFREIQDQSWRAIRVVCALFYAVGLLLFTFLLYQNIKFVVAAI